MADQEPSTQLSRNFQGQRTSQLSSHRLRDKAGTTGSSATSSWSLSSMKTEIGFILRGKLQHASPPRGLCSVLKAPAASEILPRCTSAVRVSGVDGQVLGRRWEPRGWEEDQGVLSARVPLELGMRFSKSLISRVRKGDVTAAEMGQGDEVSVGKTSSDCAFFSERKRTPYEGGLQPVWK